MDTATAFQNVRQALATIEALQPEDSGIVASTVGMTLILTLADGTSGYYQFQHVAGETLRVSTRSRGFDGSLGTATAAPLTTDRAVTDYLRALVVEVLR